MKEKLEEAQRKVDRMPGGSPLQLNIKAAVQEVLNCVKELIPKPVAEKDYKDVGAESVRSFIPDYEIPGAKTELGPDPRELKDQRDDRETRDVNEQLDEMIGEGKDG